CISPWFRVRAVKSERLHRAASAWNSFMFLETLFGAAGMHGSMYTHGLIMYRHVIGSLAGPGQFLDNCRVFATPNNGRTRGAVAGRDLLTRIPNRGFGACVSSLSVRCQGREGDVSQWRTQYRGAARKGTDGADGADQR